MFRTTILQVTTPDALRGRLQGVFTVVVAGGPHLGSLLLGTLATATSEPSAAIIGGLACALVVTVISIRQKGLIAYDARHPGTEDGIRTGLQSGGAGKNRPHALLLRIAGSVSPTHLLCPEARA